MHFGPNVMLTNMLVSMVLVPVTFLFLWMCPIEVLMMGTDEANQAVPLTDTDVNGDSSDVNASLRLDDLTYIWTHAATGFDEEMVDFHVRTGSSVDGGADGYRCLYESVGDSAGLGVDECGDVCSACDDDFNDDDDVDDSNGDYDDIESTMALCGHPECLAAMLMTAPASDIDGFPMLDIDLPASVYLHQQLQSIEEEDDEDNDDEEDEDVV